MNECAAEVIVVEVVGVSSMCDNCTELFLINRITVGARYVIDPKVLLLLNLNSLSILDT